MALILPSREAGVTRSAALWSPDFPPQPKPAGRPSGHLSQLDIILELPEGWLGSGLLWWSDLFFLGGDRLALEGFGDGAVG